MKEILSGRITPELGGELKTVCILFSDIRGYTTRSEGMTPQQAFVRAYEDSDDEKMDEIRARVDTIVADPATAD